MANKDEYEAAIARVKAGQATSRDRELTERFANQSGEMARKAREAQEADKKKADKPKGLFG